MVRLSSALGIRPHACTTRQSVYKLVSFRPQKAVLHPLSFLLRTLWQRSIRQLLCNHNSSALFTENAGGGYTPNNVPLVFKGLRTLTPSDLYEGLSRSLELACRLVLEFQAVSSALAARGNTDHALSCSGAHTSLNWNR
jgi:hypothetical protein